MLRGLAEHDGASSNVGENKDTGDAENEFEEVCRGCIGILQFLYIDDKGISVRKNHACDFAAAVGEPLKHGGQKIDGFSLHVSLPPVVVDNEQALWSYINEKCSSESWFTEKFPPASITVKAFLKLSVANPLEKLLGVKCQESSFRRG